MERDFRCYRCGRELDPESVVWLELNCSTGEWVESDSAPWSDGPESQGCFEFGKACAARVLREQKVECYQ